MGGHKGWDVRVHQAAQKEKDSQIQMVLKMICSELKRSRDGDTADSVPDLYAVVEGSTLLPFLETKLQASSFLEIDQHAAVYRVILEIVQEMSKDCRLVGLLGTLPHQNVSIHCLLQGIQAQARVIVKKVRKAWILNGG